MLDTTGRRAEIIKLLKQSINPITGAELAQQLEVSRQVIVQDVAVLRAAGKEILASPQGYYLYQTAPERHRIIVAVQHTPTQTERELNALVDIGVEVVDVIIDHPIYGEQHGMLHIASRYDVQLFLDRIRDTGAHLLSELTDGLHLHTLEASHPAPLDRARTVLRELGFLVE